MLANSEWWVSMWEAPPMIQQEYNEYFDELYEENEYGDQN